MNNPIEVRFWNWVSPRYLAPVVLQFRMHVMPQLQHELEFLKADIDREKFGKVHHEMTTGYRWRIASNPDFIGEERNAASYTDQDGKFVIVKGEGFRKGCRCRFKAEIDGQIICIFD